MAPTTRPPGWSVRYPRGAPQRRRRPGERLPAITAVGGEGSVARELNEVGVVGLGTMGAGITEVRARGGLSVTAIEVSKEALARGRGHLEQSTERAVGRGKLDP